MASISVAARKLASAHRKQDKKTTVIKFFPSTAQDEIRLLEVSKAAPTTGEVIPYRFNPHLPSGIEFPSVVVLLSPEEWNSVEKGDLKLPAGWDLNEAQDL